MSTAPTGSTPAQTIAAGYSVDGQALELGRQPLERSDQPGKIYANGGATTVWVDFPQQRSVPLPPGLRALCD